MKIKYYLCGSEQPISQYPLGLGYLLSNAKGYDAEIVDKPADLRGADVIGLSTLTDGLVEAVEVARMFPSYPVIVGGQGTLWPGIIDVQRTRDGTNLQPAFDVVIQGEGERSMNFLGKDWFDGARPVGKIGTEGKSIGLTPSNYYDLDELKPPERGHCGNAVPILTSRGCPHNCKFCSSQTYWGKPRYHSAEYVIDEVKMLSRRYKQSTKLRIFDDSFISDKARFEEIYRLWMKSMLWQRWQPDGFVRADDITKDIAIKLKQMGFRFVRFGADAASTRLLKSAGKTTTAEDNQRCIDVCNAAGLGVCMSLIQYLPGETIEDRRQLSAFLRKNKGKVSVAGNYRFRPFPGTAYYDGEDVLKEDWRVR